jgi:large subunit ribosomal protein L18
MKNMQMKSKARIRRHHHVRKKVFGTLERPRLSVFRSGKHMYAQLIDDLDGKTLAGASTLDKDFGKGKSGHSNREAASRVGSIIAKRALTLNFKKVVFDRNGYLYHGRVKALAEAARLEGLIF